MNILHGKKKNNKKKKTQTSKTETYNAKQEKRINLQIN